MTIMHRDIAGEPKPVGIEQLKAALYEKSLNASECRAKIYDSRGEDDPFDGWTAEIVGINIGGVSVTMDTGAWEAVGTLLQDFQTLGFPMDRIDLPADVRAGSN
jgi:hypothetical protein